jgi:hypothetical protein
MILDAVHAILLAILWMMTAQTLALPALHRVLAMRPDGVTALGNSTADGKPLAVPLAVAAQILGKRLSTVERAGVEPYRHQDGHDVYSLRELRVALGLAHAKKLKVTNDEYKAQRRAEAKGRRQARAS